ncbi:sodium:calcium antiporter [Jeotgalibacillus proteolyticus]|uniref:Cation transporter n=1 Tax=Jeotgalibacillus proteolyticus TaxID=2082395 RepID=A0A2S5GCE8_9BACL|nr:sodium:calcium antiporter [Jeotgalibacillus proteolyticus]PPA70676.1 cation transporter [Jeotgalibacillus proteolyticus]
MVYLIFGLAAAVTVLAAIELSNHADVLSERTSLGGLLIGTLLLGGATSLPEVTTSLSAVFLSNPDIAVGNMLGSNLFNLFIIASFDLLLRKYRIYRLANGGHLYTAGLGLALSAMMVMALERQTEYTFYGVGLDSFLIAFVYGTGMLAISKISRAENTLPAFEEEETERPAAGELPGIKRTIIGFVIAAAAIMGAGSLLSITGDRIAEITGVGSTFIGSFLMAATTSLPEAVAVLIALKLRNVNLAIGSILGSNIFNMLILVVSDIAYREGPILADVSRSHEVTAVMVSLMAVLLMYSIARKNSPGRTMYSIPSLLIVIGYFITTYLLFNG